MGQKEPEARSTGGEKRRNVSVRDVAHVSPTTVKWAIQRAHTNPEELASRIKSINASQIRAWASGESLPTFSQAEVLADKLRLPFAILFMNQPPKLDISIPDLRTIGNNQRREFSLDFIDVLNDALVKQQWYREQQEENNAPKLPFVGKFIPNGNAETVAADMAATLGIDDELRRKCTSWEAFFTCFVHQAEELGVLVMRRGIVRHDTRRGLDIREFRGFAISDDLAPLVFINARDAKAAQTFTLAHELAHLWIGQSGISNNPERKKTSTQSINKIELFCNRVAAELLVPRQGFEEMWRRSGDTQARLGTIATKYRVSRMVAIMRAYELNHLSYSEFSALMDAEFERFERQAKEKEEGSGGNFWNSFSARIGHVLQDAVVKSLNQGKLPYRDAANLLGLRFEAFAKYLKNRAGE